MKTNSNQTEAKNNLLTGGDQLIIPTARKAKLTGTLSTEEKSGADVIIKKQIGYLKDQKVEKAGDLNITGKQLLNQYKKREGLAVKLAIANEKLHFQNVQHKKRAEELEIANHELILQSEINRHHAKELKDALRELESFSYSVSHDLRAPLRAISGLTRVLAEDYITQLDDDAKELMNDVIRNSNKMAALIDNLLEFSRIGKQHISMGDVNINQLVSTVIAEQKRSEPDRVFSLTISDMENVQGDRDMLKQVFINLVSNAFKYTGKRTTAIIEIGSHRQNKDIVYYIKDNGAGFDMNYYDKLFGVFQRLHSSSDFDGTGVGLAIIQKIIARHHGKVWAEGKVNEGACFYFSLPIEQ